MYNNDVYLLDAQYIKTNSTVFDNVEDRFIEPSILRVQNIYIQDLIGTNLYQTIYDAYNAYFVSSTAIPTRLSNLVDNYLLPVILHRVIYEMLPEFYVKITSQGVLRSKGTDNGDAISSDDLDRMLKFYQDRAEFYNERTINFLIDNTTIYTEYLQAQSEDDIIPTSRAYKGFYISGGSLRKNIPYCNGSKE